MNTPNQEVDTLIDQLNRANTTAKQNRTEEDPLKKEEVEKFVIEKSGELIRESLDMIRTMKDFVISSPNGRDVEALAGLISAASSAIETLNKQVIMDRKAEVVYKSKEMDARNRKDSLLAETQAKIAVTREEMVKSLAEQAHMRMLDTTVVDISSTSCSPDYTEIASSQTP